MFNLRANFEKKSLRDSNHEIFLKPIISSAPAYSVKMGETLILALYLIINIIFKMQCASNADVTSKTKTF